MHARRLVAARVRDEEVVAIVVKVILREGTVATRRALAELVNDELSRKDDARVTPARVRVLAARSGLVGLAIRARLDGPPGDMKECPVCRSKLKLTENRTLTGKSAATGYKCTRCPWWTGRELRVPHHYTFTAKVSRGKGSDQTQLAFVPRSRRA
jgi:hypothetical protein